MVCSLSASSLFQPALPTAARMATKFLMRVSSRRKCVCMSMMNWSLSPSARSCAIAGVAASAGVTSKKCPKISFIATKDGRHAGRGLEETAARQSLLARQAVAEREQARLQFALLLGLRIRVVLVAGDDLGRDRRLVRQQFRRRQTFAILVADEPHGFLLSRSPVGLFVRRTLRSISERRGSAKMTGSLFLKELIPVSRRN